MGFSTSSSLYRKWIYKINKSHIVPEFYQSEIEKLISGSKIYKLKSDGMLIEIAELNKELGQGNRKTK